MENANLITLLKSQYQDSAMNKDTMYFILDTKEIAIGNKIVANFSDLSDYITKDDFANEGIFEVAETLPTENIKVNKIYLVPKSTVETDNIKDEYIYVNDEWEYIGSTQLDLSNYLTETDADGKYQTKLDSTQLDNINSMSSILDMEVDDVLLP